MLTTPVISNLTVSGLPQLIRRELGERTLAQAVRAAGVDLETIEGESCFIPHAAALRFIETAAHAAGEVNFGLLMAPQMDVANYGTYGRYIYAAETLGLAIGRAIEALAYHSNADTMALDIRGDEARFSYGFALAGRTGYHHVANVAAGALLSVCRHFLSANWRPLRIELDIPRPRQTAPFEDMFRCPVVFNAPMMTVVFDRNWLDARRSTPAAGPIISIADVARDRRGAAPRDTLGVISEHIRLQLRGGSMSIDSTARAMDTSIRTLQRELNREGTDFRTLANAARAGRAHELLQHTDASITRIAAELGYSTPANFSRAFRNATGMNPSALRASD
ncbi:AraC-like DNA-binding protein [Rhodoligotrophos appendicifer]|uniref:AraC family transcriptional regulator n=1 Tax=Rhodoligotrophos appendicifer TaxID=987056 RepID=UPI0011852A10|nr:AraC family transcriptional regulator [Rhodoligotrophos appendicifer]